MYAIRAASSAATHGLAIDRLMTTYPDLVVENLSVTDRAEIVDVLAAAFRDYPTFQYMLGRDYAEDDPKLHALLGFYTDKRLVQGWPVLGIRKDGRLLAVCLISPPQSTTTLEIARLEALLKAEIGEEAYLRVERFENASDEMEPREPHHFVGILGVHPAQQGNGYGKAILQRVKNISESSGSAGICLSTEDANNLPIYERLGFSIVDESKVDDLHIWCLVWPNREYVNEKSD